MKKAISIFIEEEANTLDPAYSISYTYDNMKIMAVIAEDNTTGLDFEDLCFITCVIQDLWNASYTHKRNKNKTPSAAKKVLENDDFYMCQTTEEDGYSQAYAARVRDEIIKAYKEVYNS